MNWFGNRESHRTDSSPNALEFFAFQGTQSATRKRYRRMLAAILSAFAGRGMSLVVNAISVPLTVRYLGNESYGLWVAITSTVTMYLVLDIGIASTLTNLISEAYARNDDSLAARYSTTAFWLILAITVTFGIFMLAAWPWIKWGPLFGIHSIALAREASHTVAIAFLLFLAGLPASLATKILAGYQELHIANFFSAGGNVLSLVSVIAVVLLHGSLPILVAAYTGSPVAMNFLCLAWLWLVHKPWLKPWPTLIAPQYIGRIFRSGSQFFVIQIGALVVSNSDNVVISHYLGPAEVTPYTIAWRLTSYLISIQGIIFPAIWPAYSEAYLRGDFSWVRSTYYRMRKITFASVVIGGIGFSFFGREIIEIWAGPAVKPSSLLICLMSIWMAICAIAINQACLMGALGRVKRQAVCSVVATVANLTLSIWWVQKWGTTGVVLGTIVSYVFFVLTTQSREIYLIFHQQPPIDHQSAACATPSIAMLEEIPNP